MRTRTMVLSAKALKRLGCGGFLMKHPVRFALMGTLLAVAAPAAEVNVSTTTIAQQWKLDTPGFDKANCMPATEFLGIDVTDLGSQKLSMHLFGWGTTDLQDQSSVDGKHYGNLTYGFLQYNFDQANAMLKAGEIGVSYLQDGRTTTVDLASGNPNYTRKQLGADLHLVAGSWVDLSGRTLWNQAEYVNGTAPSRVAEDDFSATLKLAETLKLSGQFVERNLSSYFAGSTLPNLFNVSAAGQFKATGGSLTWTPGAAFQLVADVRRTDRQNYGDTTRFGGDLRLNFGGSGLLAGAGYHRVTAFSVVQVDPAHQSYSLTHDEARAWALWTKGAWTASVDAIQFKYSDATINPILNGKASEAEVVGGLGYQLTPAFKVSGDLTYESTPIYQKQVIGLLRIEYRFGSAGLGGK